jgi:hypothetical protein
VDPVDQVRIGLAGHQQLNLLSGLLAA